PERHPVRLAELLPVGHNAVVPRRRPDRQSRSFEPADEFANVLPHLGPRQDCTPSATGSRGAPITRRPSYPSLSKLLAANAVEHKWSEGVVAREERMLKVVRWVARHAEALHDSPRTDVADGREGNDLLEAQMVEAEGDGCPSPFRRVAASPVLACEAPADLDGRAEVGFEERIRQAHEADGRRAPRPMKPMNALLCMRSTPHSPHPRSTIRLCSRSASASLSSRGSELGKYRITSGSALSTANGSKSALRHRRST